MSTTLDAIIGGIDEPIRVQFKNKAFDSVEDPEPFDATGKTVSLELKGIDGVAVVTTAKVEWEDALLAKAIFNRLSADLTHNKSPYKARWFVTDTDGTHPYPSTRLPDDWIVVPATL